MQNLNSNFLTASFRLNSGYSIPCLGLGTYKITGPTAKHIFLDAIMLGYRHFDTATVYENEAELGQAIKECGLPREELFITTKLSNEDQLSGNLKAAFNLSLKKLGTDFIDLYLLHWPVKDKFLASWDFLLDLKEKKLARSIGVSNFTIAHLQILFKHSPVIPSINQIEFSPFLYQPELLDFCRQYGILVEAYSPLTRGVKLNQVVLVEVAKKLKRTVAQVMLRFCYQLGMLILPKASSIKHMRENSQLSDFELTKNDMQALMGLNSDFRIAPDPNKLF